MSVTLNGSGTIGGSQNITINKKLSLTDQVWTQPYPVGHPLSIGGCMSWVDYQFSSPDTTDTANAYSVKDLANRGISWHARSQQSAGWRNTQFQTGLGGITRKVMKTGTTTDAGIIATVHNRVDWRMTTMNNTWIFWVWRDGGAKNSNESLMTQNQYVSSNYMIIRGYPSYWDIYNDGSTDSRITQTNTGSYTTGWSMLTFTTYTDTSFQVGLYNSSNQNGAFDTGTLGGSGWNMWGTGGSRALYIGGSEWGSNSGEPWGVGSDRTGYGCIGAHMLYNSALSRATTKSIFDFYKGEFGIA